MAIIHSNLEGDMDVVGIDIGFGFTKATNGRECIVFKSLLGEAADIQFRMSMGKGDSNRSMHVVVDDLPYFVGDFAEQQSNVRQFTLDQEKLMGEFVKVLALTAIGQLWEKPTPINLVSGLPVGYYKQFSGPFIKPGIKVSVKIVTVNMIVLTNPGQA